MCIEHKYLKVTTKIILSFWYMNHILISITFIGDLCYLNLTCMHLYFYIEL